MISMAGKRVLLTLNKKVHEFLKKKAEDNYMSIQELISGVLRKSVLASQPRKRGKVGRPPKIDDKFLEYFSRKKQEEEKQKKK